MNKKTIEEAVQEAQEFINRAKTVLKEEASSKHCHRDIHTGALRRQSMELTRVLARLRKWD